MRPVCSRPMRAHVRPASVDLNMPSPTEMWLRMHDSPVPAHTVLGSDGAMARSPMECTGWSSKMGSQCTPPSTVLKMPPDADPA